MFHPTFLYQITRFFPVTPPPGTPADCLRATRLVPTWVCALPLHSSTLLVTQKPFSLVIVLNDRLQHHILNHVNQNMFTLCKKTIIICWNIHSDSRFTSLSIAVMSFINRPVSNESVYHNAGKSLCKIFFCCVKGISQMQVRNEGKTHWRWRWLMLPSGAPLKLLHSSFRRPFNSSASAVE